MIRMSDLHLTLKGQQDVSLLVTALQREKDLIDVQLQKSHEKLTIFEQKFSQSSERFYETIYEIIHQILKTTYDGYIFKG